MKYFSTPKGNFVSPHGHVISFVYSPFKSANFCIFAPICLQVVRCICILDHPIAQLPKDAMSWQIIIPQKEVGRKSGIIGDAHLISPYNATS